MARVAGTVVEVRDGRAWVECAAEASGCTHCAGGRGCAWARTGPRRVALESTLGGRELTPGERVQLEADERRLLGAALRLYLPPLVGLLAGPALLRASQLDAGVLPLLAATCGLLAGAAVARHLTRRAPPVEVFRA